MTDALQTSNLPPAAIALIKEGSPKPQTQAAVLPDVDTPKPVLAVKPVTEPAPLPKPKAQKEREKTPETAALVSVNFRLPAHLPSALLKISSERKLKKIRPYTQQDIIAEAITEWLKKNDTTDK